MVSGRPVELVSNARFEVAVREVDIVLAVYLVAGCW